MARFFFNSPLIHGCVGFYRQQRHRNYLQDAEQTWLHAQLDECC